MHDVLAGTPGWGVRPVTRFLIDQRVHTPSGPGTVIAGALTDPGAGDYQQVLYVVYLDDGRAYSYPGADLVPFTLDEELGELTVATRPEAP